jgi:hypothetical protein
VAAGYGSPGCPDLFILPGDLNVPNYAHAYQGKYPYAIYSIRHCNGSYEPVRSLGVDLKFVTNRQMIASEFPGEEGVLYAGGYIAMGPATDVFYTNTDWIYRGVPGRPPARP